MSYAPNHTRVEQIQIQGLTKSFSEQNGKTLRAINELSLSVADQEWLVVTGPSGCGKTTLLRLIAGLDAPDAGDILLNGRSLLRVPAEKRNVAMVFQEPALYPHLTVAENIGFGLKIRRHSGSEIRERVDWAADMLEIRQCLSRRPMEISGGQRQRVAVARAMVRRPELFLFDEPLASLDLPTRSQLRRKLRQVCRASRSTVIYVTHDQEEAMSMADTLAIMNQGRLEQCGKPLHAYHHPSNLFVASFLGSPGMNFCKGALLRNGSGWSFQTGQSVLRLPQQLDTLALPHHKTAVLGIRPEDLSLTGEASDDALEATIVAVEQLGSERRVHLMFQDQEWVLRVYGPAGHNAPGPVRIRFRPEGVRFFDPETGQALL